MAEPFRIAFAVLAAGQSSRFGEEDKLTAKLRGTMLGLHAVAQLAGIEASHKWVVASRRDHDCAQGWREAGFEIVENPEAESGMGSSVALAASLAIQSGSDALLICLADMPLVPQRHYEAILESARALAEDGIAASSTAEAKLPPACFRSGRFAQLASLRGDAGARCILRDAHIVPCASHLLADIDAPSDLSKLQSTG